MTINFEVQNLCIPEDKIRGVAYYTLKLIRSLRERNTYQYTLSYFDYKGERSNREYITHYFSDLFKDESLLECNSLSYKKIIDYSGDKQYKLKKYKDYFSNDAGRKSIYE